MNDKKNLVVLVAESAAEVGSLALALKEYDVYRVVHCSSVEHIDGVYKAASVLSIILELDGIQFKNRDIKKIAERYPNTPLLSMSRQRLHPHLKEAISKYIFACLIKPLDPDELHYFLRCIHENSVEKRGPPVRAKNHNSV